MICHKPKQVNRELSFLIVEDIHMPRVVWKYHEPSTNVNTKYLNIRCLVTHVNYEYWTSNR